MEDRQRLSRWMYSVLEKVGASERLRQLHRESAVADEILATMLFRVMHGELINAFQCGSSYEGSITPALASDVDVIYCQSWLPVVLEAAAAPPDVSYLMVRDSMTYPGYVKLQSVCDGQLQYAHHRLPTEYEDVDNAGRICYKHLPMDNMQGPASRHFDENGVHDQDFVPALRCDYIPQCALEWIIRPRPYGWLSQDQLQTLGTMGCMVVGVGHVNSGEKDIEWRMSFTLQERMLMSSLNPVQHKVYILLKMLKKHILNNVIHKETLTSYHFKTCILYAVHMSPAHVWKRDNIVNCLMWCIQLMVKWLETNYCPSYLIQYQNLFIKEGFSRLRMEVLIEMRRLIESGHQFLFMLQSDNIGDILRNGDWRMYRDVTIDATNTFIWTLKSRNVIRFYFFRQIFQSISNGNYDPFTVTLVLDILKNAQINHYSAEVTQSAMAFVFPWLHLHIANGLASLTHMCLDRAVRKLVMERVEFHLNEAGELDLVNGRLAKASMLYKFGKHEECSHLLFLIESDFIYNVTLMCNCTYKSTIPYTTSRDLHERKKKLARMSIRHIFKSTTAGCVVFLPSATTIAPEPLQYEMQRSLGTLPGSRNEDIDFWFDWAVVDARIYLYFLQYLVNSKLHKAVHRNVARDNLCAAIYEDDLRVAAGQQSWLGHKDTAFNLLGWIHMQEDRLAKANVCFQRSLKIRPFHNAAKYHMRNLKVRLAAHKFSNLMISVFPYCVVLVIYTLLYYYWLFD